MAKKQTRRSISVTREAYDKLKLYADKNDISMSKLTEAALDLYIARQDIKTTPARGPTGAFGTNPAGPAPLPVGRRSTDAFSF